MTHDNNKSNGVLLQELQDLRRENDELKKNIVSNGLKNNKTKDLVTDNISEHKKSEEMFTDVNERLNSLIEAIPDCIFFKDGSGKLLVTNEPAKELFKLKDFDWFGKTDLEMADERPELSSAHKQCYIDDELAWQEAKLSTFDEFVADDKGIIHQFEVRKMPLFYPDGNRKGLVITASNITEKQKNIVKIK